MHSKQNQVVSVAVIIMLQLFVVVGETRAETCVTSGSSDVRVCVDWSEQDDPIVNQDFTVDYSVDPANPDIELITGSLTWQVWAEDKNDTSLPANIGTISADGAEDYSLFLAEPGVPLWTFGADNVGSILLLPKEN
ncbi:MAG: hypothetical protein IH988_10245, partial [Planctomycetes bacterium]|nr:hypothetical protein [Planctomycetota bacterium]